MHEDSTGAGPSSSDLRSAKAPGVLTNVMIGNPLGSAYFITCRAFPQLLADRANTASAENGLQQEFGIGNIRDTSLLHFFMFYSEGQKEKKEEKGQFHA